MFQFLMATIASANKSLARTHPLKLIVVTIAVMKLLEQVPTLKRAYRARYTKTMAQRRMDAIYALAKYIPQVRESVRLKMEKLGTELRQEVEQARAGMTLKATMPKAPVSPLAILSEFGIDETGCLYDFANVNEADKTLLLPKDSGKESGALYAVYPTELKELLKEVYGANLLTNPMHDNCARIQAMRAEVIAWCQQLFFGKPGGSGVITHGGTGSIIEAMIAYVGDARAKGISHPEIIVPSTAHEAFTKAAKSTGATLIKVPVDLNTGAVSANAMRQAISKNTAVMVGSEPSFMNGVCEPLDELAKLALEKNIPFHVDACLGGFLSVFKKDYCLPKGVSSVSADFHKYGLCPKGTSICLFSKYSPVDATYQGLDWCGGLYTTPGMLDGSASGARIAEIYTVLSYFGFDRYVEIKDNIFSLQHRLSNAIRKAIKQHEILGEQDLSIFGVPKNSVIGFKSNHPDSWYILAVANRLSKTHGWELNALQNPNGFHFCLTLVHTLKPDLVESFTKDLIESALHIKQHPELIDKASNVTVYGAVDDAPSEVHRTICKLYHGAKGLFACKLNNQRLLEQPDHYYRHQ